MRGEGGEGVTRSEREESKKPETGSRAKTWTSPFPMQSAESASHPILLQESVRIFDSHHPE